jgi:hypothetical protein
VTYIGEIPIGLTLVEMSETVEMAHVGGKQIPVAELKLSPKGSRTLLSAWTSKQDIPSCRLRLHAYSPYYGAEWNMQWDEKVAGDFHKLIPGIVKQLEAAVPTISRLIEEARQRHAEERAEREARWKLWEEEDRIRKRKERQQHSRQQLGSIFGEWERQHRLDAFFASVLQHAQTLAPGDREGLERKAAEARRLLGEVDCVQSFVDWEPPEP